MRVQFVHGLEGSPHGRKATLLREHFDAHVPAMDTSDFDACVALQTREIEAFRPDVLVGSSFGGAVVVELLRRGAWAGPTLLLAQAALWRGQDPRLPEGVPVWLVHGTRDELIPVDHSRTLAATGTRGCVRLVEVDDDHALSASVAQGDLLHWVRELARLHVPLPSEWPELEGEALRIWEGNAAWWDDRIGDGNAYQDELIEPATLRLVDPQPGMALLDLACGAGRLSRRLALAGALVTACDVTEAFLARARERTPPELETIEYRRVDATDREALLALGAGRFDGAVATMALMDMAEVEPLFQTLPRLLKPHGFFVATVMHPCFESPGALQFAEGGDDEGTWRTTVGLRVRHYLTPRAHKGIGILGQPEPQLYFHRPLHVLLGVAFRSGFVVDGWEEPRLAGPASARDERRLGSRHRAELPPILAVRFRATAS